MFKNIADFCFLFVIKPYIYYKMLKFKIIWFH